MLAEIFGPDLLIVVLVIVVLIFGGAAIPKLARNLGSAQGEFKKGMSEAKDTSLSTDATPSSNGTKSGADVPSKADPEGSGSSAN
jgi:sec-independent protein translocase protein TatA